VGICADIKIILMTKFEELTRGRGILENYLAKKRARMADSLIPYELRSGRILDIGCGTTPYFLINTNFKEKHGIDPALKDVVFEHDIKLQKLDIDSKLILPFESEYFDIVVMLAVIEHLKSQAASKLVGEIIRILKPGGRLIITTPSPSGHKLLNLMVKLALVSRTEIADHKQIFDHSSLYASLEQAGFSKDKIILGQFELGCNIWAYVDK
jgi:SAM-dependent methyltransferase